MIYLDNAATTLKKPDAVIEAVVNAMNQMGNSSRGAHGQALCASRVIYETRELLARFFGCPRADHVIFTSNSTEALNLAINGLLNPGDHAVTTDLEHNSVLRPLYRLEDAGLRLSFARADRRGCVRPEQLENLIEPDTRAIICTHASNLTGNVQDLKAIGTIAERHGIPLIVDASQTAGVFPIDMEDMNLSIVCFTGHKSLMGPQGTGGLCIRGDLILRPLKVGGSGIQTYSRQHPCTYPTALEAGTLNGHGIAGLKAGLEYILSYGMDRIRREEQALMNQFYEGVLSIPGVTVYGDFTTRDRAPIVALNLEGWDSAEVSDALSERWGIATRPGAHCAPRMHQALGTTDQGAVRFSFSHFNTTQEVQTAIEAVRTLAEE